MLGGVVGWEWCIRDSAKPTPAGVLYYAGIGVDPTQSYAYEQPLLNDKWAIAFDGTRVKVRERNVDGPWRITRKGEDYFRSNRTENLPSVPPSLIHI